MKISSKRIQKQFARVGRIFPKSKFEVAYSGIGYSKLNPLENTKEAI